MSSYLEILADSLSMPAADRCLFFDELRLPITVAGVSKSIWSPSSAIINSIHLSAAVKDSHLPGGRNSTRARSTSIRRARWRSVTTCLAKATSAESFSRTCERQRGLSISIKDHQLPDYLPVLLRLLTRLDDQELRTALIAECLIPGLEKMLKAVVDSENPYRQLLLAIAALLETEVTGYPAHR